MVWLIIMKIKKNTMMWLIIMKKHNGMIDYHEKIQWCYWLSWRNNGMTDYNKIVQLQLIIMMVWLIIVKHNDVGIWKPDWQISHCVENCVFWLSTEWIQPTEKNWRSCGWSFSKTSQTTRASLMDCLWRVHSIKLWKKKLWVPLHSNWPFDLHEKM